MKDYLLYTFKETQTSYNMPTEPTVIHLANWAIQDVRFQLTQDNSLLITFKNSGNFEEAYIGISAYDSNVIPYLSSSYTNFTSGIYVVEIDSNSPASSSGLQSGDIINSIDGLQLTTMNDLKEYIYTKKPNDTVTLNVSRGKISKEISIILGKK